MKYKVIFDTNSVYDNNSHEFLFGFREDLQKFHKIADLYIPDIVLDELIACKKRFLLGDEKDKFIKNIYSRILGIKKEKIDSFNIDSHLSKLIENETIPYTVIKIQETKNLLQEIRNLAVNKEAPFENRDGTDKGFKDSYIYFTILDFLKSCEDKKIFVVVKDDRLKEALSKIENVITIKDYSEFEKYLDDYFSEDYFISRLKEEIDERINKDCIEDSWLNIDDNWVLKIKCEECLYLVEIDFVTKEIISSIDSDIAEAVNALALSGSFSSTHSAISDLSDKIKYLSDEDIQKLIKASVENEQISWISEDEDVKGFFKNIYQVKQKIIPEDIEVQFLQHFK